MLKLLKTILIFSLVPLSSLADDLPVEPIPNVEKLPGQYPDSWLFVHDTNFYSLVDGKVILVDVAAQTNHYKGAIGAAQFATFIQGKKRNELYVGETFYSRGVRGERIDVLTIYDASTLEPVEEIVLPGNKRGLSVTQKSSLQLSRNERFLFVYNFTPAASVSVIDIAQRSIVSDIDIPGCSLIYPTGEQSFATMCGNGTMVAFTLDNKGQIKASHTTPSFNDIDNNALFMKTTKIGSTLYFPSFKGLIQPVDMASDKPVAGQAWTVSIAGKTDHGFRPAGWQVISSDVQKGHIYLLMQPEGKEGSHKDGGSEVWVVDVATKQTIKRITLKNWSVSIEITGGETPYLVASNINSDLDVYDASSGEFMRVIGGRLAENPFVLHAAK